MDDSDRCVILVTEAGEPQPGDDWEGGDKYHWNGGMV